MRLTLNLPVSIVAVVGDQRWRDGDCLVLRSSLRGDRHSLPERGTGSEDRVKVESERVRVILIEG